MAKSLVPTVTGAKVAKKYAAKRALIKEQIRDLNMGGEISYGHLGYPVLQAADILMYQAHAVPVGEDQLPHLELTREMARRFNRVFGEVFPEPEPLITKFARFPGTDGKRMSKSLGNFFTIRTVLEKYDP